MHAHYRGPDGPQIETILEEIEKLQRLMKSWAEGPPILLQLDEGHVTPRELVQVLGEAAEPWARARAAWQALRQFEAELPVRSRRVTALLRALRRAIACALGPREAARLLSRSKRATLRPPRGGR